MNLLKNQEKRKFKQQEKRFQKRSFTRIVILVLIAIIYRLVFQPKTIGESKMYDIYVFWIPVIIGVFVLAFYRRAFLMYSFKKNKGLILWGFMTIFYLLQGVFLSYLSFGQLALITWNILNKNVAEKSPKEIVTCDIRGYSYSRMFYNIHFTFEGKKLSLGASSSEIDPLRGQNYKNFKIAIEVQKGIWDHYLVKDYSLIEK